MRDGKIIELFENRDESAIEQAEIKYGKYCRTVADNILRDSQDTEECVNDTWLKLWNSIPPLKPDNLKLFIARITRNIAINRYKANNAKKRGSGGIGDVLEELEECIPDRSFDVESELMKKELSKAISVFLKNQTTRRSNFFVRRYFYGETIEEIAERYDVTVGNVMTSLSRTRKELKKYLRKEGYE